MPVRRTPLVSNQYYHIFNRSVGRIPIFKYQGDYQRALEILSYYRFQDPPFSFSKLKRLNQSQQAEVLSNLEKKRDFLIEIISFCLMPNHFHLLLKQIREGGVTTFLANFQNSFAKYFNTRYHRSGAVFQNSFKAILIETDEQLLHLSRYIHLNPYSSFIIKKKEEILSYPWSSLGQYLGETGGFCQPGAVISQFSSALKYQKFVLDQADYQRELERIKHLILE